MANITQILGTDSLSSSRIILNDNFSNLNTGLSAVESLLDTSNQTLSLIGKISGGELEINNGTINTLSVTSTQVVHNVESKFTANVLLEKSIAKKASSSAASAITTQPTINQYEESTYFINANSLTTISLFAAQEGREVTFIPVGGSVTFEVNGANAPISGYTTDIIVADSRTITLRYYGSSWYVISNNA